MTASLELPRSTQLGHSAFSTLAFTSVYCTSTSPPLRMVSLLAAVHVTRVRTSTLPSVSSVVPLSTATPPMVSTNQGGGRLPLGAGSRPVSSSTV